MELSPDAAALATLRRRFGFDRFRAGQEELIHAVMRGHDVLGVMPTGGGKSLGYALPSLLLPEPVLVVSPLIALMKDQVDSLVAKRIPAGFINSTVSFEEQRQRLNQFRTGALRLLFVAPERFRSPRFVRALEGFRPSLFAVDEAHCISEWGHDFRPDYLRLAEAAEQLGRPPILALTATATPHVRRHIAENLAMRQPVVIVKGFERPNLDFAVARVAGRDDKLRGLIEEVKRGRTGIVYAATRKNVEDTTRALRAAGVRAGFYHAGLEDHHRRLVQERFIDGSIPVVVATNAFGMGIDRADVRFVVHVDAPGSVEAYTQEAGRAGRDGEPSRCTLLYSASDARLQRFFIDTAYPPNDVILQTLRELRSFGEGALVDETCLADKVDAHPRAVDSAIRILCELNAASRVMDAHGRYVRVEPDVAIDLRAVRDRAERDYERLQHIIDYAERAGCHRAYLVNYFTGAGDAQPCGTCEGCRTQQQRREVTDGEMEVVRTALSLVQSLSGRYGKRRMVAILAGSQAKDILQAKLDRHPDYGRLRHLPAAFLERLLSECIGLGLLKIEGGEYPVLSITWRGREVFQGSERLELLCFDQRKKASAPSRAQSAGDDTDDPGDADADLVRDLRQWRKEQADSEGVPPYRILHNKVIDELARRRPTDPTTLLSVKGIGPEKADRYGTAILGLMRSDD